MKAKYLLLLYFIMMLCFVGCSASETKAEIPMFLEEEWFGMQAEELADVLHLDFSDAVISQKEWGKHLQTDAYTLNEKYTFHNHEGEVTFYFHEEEASESSLGLYGMGIVFEDAPTDLDGMEQYLKEMEEYLEATYVIPPHHGGGVQSGGDRMSVSTWWQGESYETLENADALRDAYEKRYERELFFQCRWTAQLSVKDNGKAYFYLLSDLLPLYRYLDDF